MPYGHFPFGMILFSGIHVVVIVGVLCLLYSISKSLKSIAGSIEKMERNSAQIIEKSKETIS